jgi:hypothetical protein
VIHHGQFGLTEDSAFMLIPDSNKVLFLKTGQDIFFTNTYPAITCTLTLFNPE